MTDRKASRKSTGELSERERRFVEAFMGEAAGNGTKAAILAGYGEKNARQQASLLLTKSNIQAAVEKRVQSDPAIATREDRQRFWTKMFYGLEEFKGASNTDRLRASELLGKSQADFVERHHLSGPNDEPVRFTFALSRPGDDADGDGASGT